MRFFRLLFERIRFSLRVSRVLRDRFEADPLRRIPRIKRQLQRLLLLVSLKLEIFRFFFSLVFEFGLLCSLLALGGQADSLGDVISLDVLLSARTLVSALV